MADTKKLNGTKTEICLANAFVAESCAYSRYTFFAKTARKELYFQVADIFDETAANELQHAKVFLKYLTEGGVVTTPIAVDPGILSPTVDNLKVAAAEEKSEGVEQYTESAKIAEEEGFHEIAEKFREIAEVENNHMERYDTLRERIEKGTMWKREKPIRWQCLVCGYIHEGKEPPEKCPACSHPYQHFMPEADNY